MALTEEQKLIRSKMFPGHRGRLAPPQQEKFVAECIKKGCPLGGDGGIESRVKRTDTVEKKRGPRTPRPKKPAAVGDNDQDIEDDEDADEGFEQQQPQRKRRGRPSKPRDTPASDKRARRPSALAIAAAETAAAEAEDEEETDEESAEEEEEVVEEEQEEERGAPNARIGQLGPLRSASRRGRGRGRGRPRGAGSAGGPGRILVASARLASLGALAAAGDGNTPADDAGSGSLGPVEYYAAYKSYYEALECYCKLVGIAVVGSQLVPDRRGGFISSDV
eukprot:gene2984-3267_t